MAEIYQKLWIIALCLVKMWPFWGIYFAVLFLTKDPDIKELRR